MCACIDSALVVGLQFSFNVNFLISAVLDVCQLTSLLTHLFQFCCSILSCNHAAENCFIASN